MKFTIDDTSMLKEVDLINLKSHLKKQGWREDSPFLENASIWLKQVPNAEEWEILLPLSENVGDYTARIQEAILTLAQVEKRTPEEIVRQLSIPGKRITLQGMINKISLPNVNQISGQVTLLAVLDNKLQKIETELFDQDYILAIKAYQERLPIFCTGYLSQTDDFFILKNPHDFVLDESWFQ